MYVWSQGAHVVVVGVLIVGYKPQIHECVRVCGVGVAGGVAARRRHQSAKNVYLAQSGV